MYYGQLAKRVGNTVRLAQVVQVLVRHGFADLVRRVGLHEGLPAKLLRGLKILEAPSGEPHTMGRRLRAVLTELGPTFIKFGQVLSTRPDIIGQDLCNELGLLQDRVTPMGFDEIAPIFERSFGAPVDALFDQFDKTPVAAASLSQVYKARLKSGQDVAVKVLRPGTKQIVESDLSLLQGIAEWVDEHVADFEWLDAPGTVEEFTRSVRREMDFTVEARIIDRFGQNFAGDVRVQIPRTHPDFCNEIVLTMDWIDGVRIDEFDRYAERESDPKAVARIGCAVLCEQVFEHHFFHADPHPGNVLITTKNRIAFLDYGMVGHLERGDVFAMADLLRAVLHDDAEACVRALAVFTSTGEIEAPEALVHEVADYIAFEAQAIMGGGEVSKALDHITRILRRNQLQLAPRFSLLLKALATIESTGHKLDPTLDMVPIVRPYAERMVMSRFSPTQVLGDTSTNLFGLMRLVRDMPGDVQSLLRALRRGKLRIQITHEGLADFAATTDRASNRLAFAIIIGSLIVASSWLITAQAVPAHLGFAGFSIAGIMGLGLAISILRSRNF